MDSDGRRAVLAAAAGALAALPGCSAIDASGPRNAPSGGGTGGTPAAVRVDEFDFEETEDGRLRVFGTVRNDANGAVTVRVTATVSVADESSSRSTELRVGGGGTAEFELRFDVNYGRFARNGEVDVDVRRV